MTPILEKRGVLQLARQLLHLISPSRLYPIPEVNIVFKERFQNFQDMLENLLAELNAVTSDDLDECFVQYLQKCEKCVSVNAD